MAKVLTLAQFQAGLTGLLSSLRSYLDRDIAADAEACAEARDGAEDAREAAEAAQTAAEDAEEAAETAQGKAEDAEDGAETQALKAEGYAVGAQDGTEAASGTYYRNNAKYYKEQAADSAAAAADARSAAEGAASSVSASAEQIETNREDIAGLQDALETKAEIDGYYDEMAVGSAEQLISTVLTEDREPYIFRTAGGSADIGNRETDMLVGGTVAWNQLVDTADTSVTVPDGHKYLSRIGGAWSCGASEGAALTVDGSAGDMVFDLTQMFGSAIAEHICTLEQSDAGAGAAWFRRLFPRDHYARNAGELMSVHVSGHKTVGFNAYDHSTGTAKVVGGQQYQITGAYTALSLDGAAVTPDADGLFTPGAGGTLAVTGGSASTTCVHLVWTGYRNDEYEPYEEHTYLLDDSLTLRGVPKLDAGSKLYYDGDTYESDGTVKRKYGAVDLGTLTWTRRTTNVFSSNLPSACNVSASAANHRLNRLTLKYATGYSVVNTHGTVALYKQSGTTSTTTIYINAASTVDDTAALAAWLASHPVILVYELAVPTGESAAPFANPQIVDDFGTEEYTDAGVAAGTRDVAIPVGHVTQYQANLRDKLQHLPDLAGSDGTYVISQSDKQMALVPLTTPTELPEAPTTDGSYVLKVTVADGETVYTWEAQA